MAADAFETVPIEQWGRDHWTTFGYLETRVVDGEGRIENAKMRTNARRHRTLAYDHPISGVNDGAQYPTRLAKGWDDIPGHDDWDCLQDFADHSLLTWDQEVNAGRHRRSAFGFVDVTVKLTELGHKVAGIYRTRLAADRGLSYVELSAELAQVVHETPAIA